jgi:flagellar capping protein FliD
MAFSSIDPAYLAQQYTQIERSSKDGVLKAQQTRFTTLLSSYQKLETSLGSMQDLLESFTKNKELLSNTLTRINLKKISVPALRCRFIVLSNMHRSKLKWLYQFNQTQLQLQSVTS